jgi:hypothetical protein
MDRARPLRVVHHRFGRGCFQWHHRGQIRPQHAICTYKPLGRVTQVRPLASRAPAVADAVATDARTPRQRIAVQYHLGALSREERDACLARQLKAACLTTPHAKP